MQRIRSLHALRVLDSTSSLSSTGDVASMKESSRDAVPSSETQQQEQHPRGHDSLQKKTRFVLLWLRRHLTSTRLQVCALALAFMLLVALVTRRMWLSSSSAQGPQLQYTVYIDGGSSGTRVHVFQYWLGQAAPRSWEDVQLVLPEKTFAVEPGLSSYAGSPQQAAAALEPLLEFAYKHVPQRLWHDTPVFLLATAGLRLLSHDDASDILDACSEYLTLNSAFKHQVGWARIISGDAEGLYAWTAVNYVSGALQAAPSIQHFHARKELHAHHKYQGVLELGGASFQVTFLPAAGTSTAAFTQEGSQQHSHLSIPGVTQPLFTHSYLGLGMDSAMHAAADIILHAHQQKRQQQQQQQQVHRVMAVVGAPAHESAMGSMHDDDDVRRVWDPCLPTGYEASDGRQGSGNFEACIGIIQRVLPPRHCRRAGKASQADEQGRQHPNSSRHLHLTAQEAYEQASTGPGPPLQPELRPGSRTPSTGTQDGSTTASSSRVSGNLESETCTFAGVAIPALDGTQFIALENFFWTARALGVGPVATLAQFRAAGEQHCQRSWSELHHLFAGHVPDPFIARYCFGAAYIYILLRERLGMSEHAPLLFTNTIKRPRLVQLQQHAQHAKHAQPAVSSSTRHLDGLGNSTGEVEVGLSWVVGAVVVQTMTPAAEQFDSQQDFFAEHENVGWLDGGTEVNAGFTWLIMLVPACFMLVLVVWACRGLGGRPGERLWQRSHAMSANAAASITRSMPLLLIGDTQTPSSATAPVH